MVCRGCALGDDAEGIITARCAIFFTPLEPTDCLTSPLAIEGCFQPSARDAQLRARQRNPRGSRNTVCTWRHRGEPEPQHGLTLMVAGREPSPGLLRRAQTGPDVAALHDRCGSSVDARCPSETDDEPRAVCAPEARRLDPSCGEARVWRTRMLSESDCVCAALQLSLALVPGAQGAGRPK